jgi:hypothetical protein
LTEKLSFAVENVELLEESNNSQFATLKIDAFASGNNRHSLYVSEETLRKTADTILEKPIIWEYSRLKDDATSHSDNQIICGFIPKDTPVEFKVLPDNRVMMSIVGKLWVRYAGKMTEIFKRDRSKSVSVEMEVLEENETSSFGIPELLSYCYLGITVLGEFVRPAIEGAKADLISFASKEQEEYQKAYELEFGRYDTLDLTIPEGVKKNVNKGLSLYKEYNIGATSVSLASARFVVKNDKITPDKLKHIAKTHKSNKFSNMTKSPPSPSYINYLLYGGKDGGIWSSEILDKLSELDKKQLSYFGEDVVTFPYKSIGEINPALKGIDPPISLSQANDIAAQADAIGGEYGWPTAINSFKKTHIVKDGKWVKKEKNMEDEKDLKKPEEDMTEAPPEKKEEEMAVDKKEEKEEPKTEEMASEVEDEKEAEGEDKEETPNEDKKEEDKESKDKEEKMSLDENLDLAALMQMLVDETEDNKELVAKYEAGEEMDYAKLCSAMFAKMSKMAEDNKKEKEDKDAYMSEYEALKKFKEDSENKQFAFEIESTIKDISETMPKDKVEEAREDSKNFSLSNIDAWKNKYKALAFTYTKEKKPNDGINRIALPYLIQNNEPEDATKEYAKNGWL